MIRSDGKKLRSELMAFSLETKQWSQLTTTGPEATAASAHPGVRTLATAHIARIPGYAMIDYEWTERAKEVLTLRAAIETARATASEGDTAAVEAATAAFHEAVRRFRSEDGVTVEGEEPLTAEQLEAYEQLPLRETTGEALLKLSEDVGTGEADISGVAGEVPRSLRGLEYSERYDRVVVWGGYGAAGPKSAHGEVFTYDPVSGRWTRLPVWESSEREEALREAAAQLSTKGRDTGVGGDLDMTFTASMRPDGTIRTAADAGRSEPIRPEHVTPTGRYSHASIVQTISMAPPPTPIADNAETDAATQEGSTEAAAASPTEVDVDVLVVSGGVLQDGSIGRDVFVLQLTPWPQKHDPLPSLDVAGKLGEAEMLYPNGDLYVH